MEANLPALLSPIVSQQSYKYTIEPSQAAIKNLFKLICAILNIRLKQSGLNELQSDHLLGVLDTINFNILDHDLILLNQMAVIKSLIIGNAFCISDKQVGTINKKFVNLYHQRLNHNDGVLFVDEEEAQVQQYQPQQRSS